MQKMYIVRLDSDERRTLTEVIKTLSGSSQKVRRAQMLLEADADGPAWTDAKIADAFGCRTRTVENLPRAIRFPNHYDVIYEDAARFRALTPEERVRALNDSFRLDHFLRSVSDNPDRVNEIAEEEERAEWQAILEFAMRHHR